MDAFIIRIADEVGDFRFQMLMTLDDLIHGLTKYDDSSISVPDRPSSFFGNGSQPIFFCLE
jgi:hypothetical protein